MTVKIEYNEENIWPVLPLTNSAESGFLFWGIIEEPVETLSLNRVKLTKLEDQKIMSSASLDKCIEQTEHPNKKSITKSLSETESMEFVVGESKPNFFFIYTICPWAALGQP